MIIETKTTSITIDHHSTSLPSVPNEIFLTSLSTCTPKSEELVDEIEIFQTRSPTPLLVKSTISPLSPDQIEPAAKRSDNLGQVSSSSPCSPLPVNDLAAQGLTIPTKASTALPTCETRSTETSLASPHPEQSPPNQPDDLTTTEPLTRSPPVEITSPPVPAPLCSTKSQTFEHLEECIISSSVEDHHYCSLTELSQDTTPSKVLDSVPSPRLECPAGPSISKPLTNPANSKRSKFKSTKPPSSKKSKSPNSKVTSTRATKAKSANSSDSIQLGNDCFKRFYLQRQLDGTFVIVPFGAPSKSVKALKTFTLASTSASELCHKSPVIILNEHSLKLNPTELTIQIDKSNLLTQLSLTDSKESPATMSALVNNKASQFGPLRPSANHFQQSTPQNRAILSALKHDHLIASSMAQLTSPPPVVTSSSFKMEEVDNYQIGQNGNANYLVQNQQNMIDQNMLVASLPPVETIFPGDRSIMNGSLANLQQSEENDQMGNTFAPTTIINDHHIDFYDHVDSTVDEDDELLSNPKYLPFGYYYDDDKVFNQLQMISSSLPSSTTSSPVLDGFDPLNDLFGSSTDKSEENMFINNEDFISYPNEMAFELDQSFGMQSSNRRTSPLCQTNAQSMMLTCDNDPLISGSDLGNSNSTKNVTYLKSVGLPSNGTAPVMLARGKGISQNTFSPMPDLNGQLFNSNQLTGDNGETLLVENGHLYSKKSSPMIIRTAADPTLAQLNLQLPMKEEDEDLLNWATSNQNGFANVTLPRNSSLLACGNVVDLNGQQHNMISSTSSPTAKTNPMAITNDKNFWFQTGMNGNLNSVVNGGNVLTSNGVTSTMLEELCVSEMDDTSLEIEAILQQSQMQMNGYGSQSNLASPPKLSSSLHMANFKSPSVHKQKIKKPNFVMPRNGDQKTLLGELLSSNNPNVSEILRSNSNPMVINVNQLNLVPKSNQMSSMSATSPQNGMANFPKVNRGKSMFNCPTLTALITSPNVNANMSPMLSSTALMNTNISNGPNMATILAHNNRIRNNSMSTDYSVSSHDEGFASQPDEESEESDDNSEEMMLINDGTDDLIDSDLFYLDNTVGNSLLNTALTNNSDDNNVAMNNNNNNSNSQELLTNSNVALVSAMANAVSADMLTTVKQEDEPVLWSSAPANLNQMQIKSEHYQQSKASTSSAIDDNESIGSDEEDDDDESFYGDYDASDLLGATTSDDMNNKWSLNMGRSRKGSEKRYFWQYNVQSKGPKGPRFNGPASSFENEDEDPHVFNEIADPVFAPDCQVEGVKHSGKARRGDGNDLTPNPKKLLMIGLELKKLSKTINDLTPVTDVPFTCRNKSRKEKNKLASRACRLKKKAQHEANKIKLHGLQREHMKLNKMIEEVRKIVDIGMKMKDVKKPMLLSIDGVTYQLTSEANIGSLMDEIVNRHKPNFEVSGRTAEFVNHILDNVSSGVSNGGIEGV